MHNALARPDLYVPKGMRERAQAIIDEAWAAEPVEDEGAGLETPADANDPKWSSSAVTAPPASATGASLLPTLVVIGVTLVLALLWVLAQL